MAKSLLDLANKSKAKVDLNVPTDYVDKSIRVDNYIDFFDDKLPERLVTLAAGQFIWPKSWVVLSDAITRPLYKTNQETGFTLKDANKSKVQDGNKEYLSFEAGDVQNALDELNRHGDATRAKKMTIHCLNTDFNLQDLVPAQTMFQLVKPQVCFDIADSSNFATNHPVIICQDIKIEQ